MQDLPLRNNNFTPNQRHKSFLIIITEFSLRQRRCEAGEIVLIARSGYLLSTGERVGQGFELVIDEKGTSIPDRLKQSPRVSYSSVTVGDVVDK